MRALLIALTVLLFAPDALGLGAAWTSRRVPVFDHTSAEWRPSVKQAVAAFNRMMPKRGPQLVYRERLERSCEKLPRYGRKGGITACLMANDQGPEGLTSYLTVDRTIIRAKMGFASWLDPSAFPFTVCHELLHAVTGAPEGKVRDAAPCAFNTGFARKVYREHGRHR